VFDPVETGNLSDADARDSGIEHVVIVCVVVVLCIKRGDVCWSQSEREEGEAKPAASL